MNKAGLLVSNSVMKVELVYVFAHPVWNMDCTAAIANLVWLHLSLYPWLLTQHLSLAVLMQRLQNHNEILLPNKVMVKCICYAHW